EAPAGQNHGSARRDGAGFAVPFGSDAEDIFRHPVLDEFLTGGGVQNLNLSFPDSPRQHLPGMRIPYDRPMVELVHTVRPRELGKLNANRLMLVLLRVATNALDPGVVLAHFLCPHPYHGVWHAVGPTQRMQISDSFLGQ